MIDYSKILSEKVSELKPSGIRKFFDLLNDAKDVVGLTVGQPDFETPWHISEEAIKSIQNGKTYYTVNGNDIMACFDDDIDNEVITAIAKQNPLYAVFKDKSFATDSVGINNEQLFKTYSPSTVVKVI